MVLNSLRRILSGSDPQMNIETNPIYMAFARNEEILESKENAYLLNGRVEAGIAVIDDFFCPQIDYISTLANADGYNSIMYTPQYLREVDNDDNKKLGELSFKKKHNNKVQISVRMPKLDDLKEDDIKIIRQDLTLNDFDGQNQIFIDVFSEFMLEMNNFEE